MDMISLLAQMQTSPHAPSHAVARDTAAWGTALIGGVWCCACVFGIAFFALWIWALIDCVQRDFKDNDKIVWVLVIVLLSWIGAIMYLVVGRPRGTKTPPSPPPGPPAS